ncbi:MAG: NAD(+)/NADH kinase [Clostridia bacterium]|nr:NAD(+)/NADH kinase [Clostridia bacterium]
MRFQQVGIQWNATKATGLDTARRLIRFLETHGVAVVANGSLAHAIDRPELSGEGGFAHCEMVAVLGGDGTILRVLDETIPNDIPVWGINLGRLGFLSETEPDELEADLTRILEGAYAIEERMTMCVDGFPNDRYFALNEIVVSRANPEIHILSLEYASNGVKIHRIAGDGLIVSSATGSTAYSLSAGGPIIAPGLDCFVLTPICPHMLNVRPVVLSSSDVISIRLTEGQESARAVLDGRKMLEMNREHPMVTIRKSERTAKFIRLHDRNYYDLLRAKLSEWTR